MEKNDFDSGNAEKQLIRSFIQERYTRLDASSDDSSFEDLQSLDARRISMNGSQLIWFSFILRFRNRAKHMINSL